MWGPRVHPPPRPPLCDTCPVINPTGRLHVSPQNRARDCEGTWEGPAAPPLQGGPRCARVARGSSRPGRRPGGLQGGEQGAGGRGRGGLFQCVLLLGSLQTAMTPSHFREWRLNLNRPLSGRVPLHPAGRSALRTAFVSLVQQMLSMLPQGRSPLASSLFPLVRLSRNISISCSVLRGSFAG